MSTEQQPEALRLADELDRMYDQLDPVDDWRPAISAAIAEDQPPAPPVKRLGNPDLIRMWGSRSDGPENSEILSFARAVEAACAAAWGVKLEGDGA